MRYLKKFINRTKNWIWLWRNFTSTELRHIAVDSFKYEWIRHEQERKKLSTVKFEKCLTFTRK